MIVSDKERVFMSDFGFKDIAETLEQSDNGLKANIPENWRQGRTAYGGVSAALALEAVQKQHSDLPPLRSALINFTGPVPANPVYRTEILRQGRNVTTLEAKGYDGDALVISVTFSFGAGRESDLSADFPASDVAAPEQCDPFTPKEMEGFIPVFFNRFETRLIDGGRPFSGYKEGYMKVWSRHKHAASRAGTASLLCIGDVLPPGAVPMLNRPGPISSMTWIFNILSDRPTTQDGWWQIETRLTAAHGGYSTQVMRIWNTSGELVAEGMQSVTIFV